MWYINVWGCFIGMFLGAVYSFVGFNGTGKPPWIQYTRYPVAYNGMCVISTTREFAIHVRRWIPFGVLIGLTLYLKWVGYIFGFSLVMFLHGLLGFTDSHLCIVKNPYFKHTKTRREDSFPIV